MKKLITGLLIVVLSSGIAFAGGDKNQGTTGSGTTSTGSTAQGAGSQSRTGR